LDVACGNGRNALYLAGQGYRVTAVDIDLSLSEQARDTPGVNWEQYDLEAQPWPYPASAWQGVVVVNYLCRSLLPPLVEALAPGGALLYATFAQGQERYGRPRNPMYLLFPGELLEVARGRMRVVAYEDVMQREPRPAFRQRLAALKL
jgi:SAM-dependent methyltransferase